MTSARLHGFVRVAARALCVTIVIAALSAAANGCGGSERALVMLATTTSVANSGLLDQVLPAYEKTARVRVRPVPVGSGRALAMLAAGQADVVITHAPQQETDGLRSHPTWWYRKILYNDFLIVGPPEDPSRVAQATNAVDAMRRISNGSARFISRGDESGTHERERQLWKEAGVVPSPEIVVAAGQGMGATLTIASEMQAYTLIDRGTFENFKGRRALKELCSGDPRLLNTYAVIADPSNRDGYQFAQWIAGERGRTVVAAALSSGVLRGFTLWPSDVPGTTPAALPSRQGIKP